MNRVLPGIGRLVIDDDGQDLLEYGLLAVLIAVVVMAGVTTVGQTIQTVFWEVIKRGF
ncbi:MAG TPA: Flp family type IVb pilin [Vicinamibacterales bacterium]|nr:Flp family type IVb pilin [Vicinamibacterales bacterium]